MKDYKGRNQLIEIWLDFKMDKRTLEIMTGEKFD